MNRRKFIAAVSALAALPSLPLFARPSNPRDRWEILSPEEISRHFIYVDRPVFITEDSLGERSAHYVKSYFTSISSVREEEWFRPNGSVREDVRRRLSRESVAYIKRWFSYHEYVWRDRADIFGPYVHSVRLLESPLVDPWGKRFHTVLMRVAYVKVLY